MDDQVPVSTPLGGTGETELRTFLIADIRGYTTYTREKGDEAAGVLAGRFAVLVREVVTARGGFLLELRGDEALVVFVSARNALRAAVELQDRFREAELPRGVGIGLDAGEAVPVEGGYRGSALNVAARLCAQAGSGEIIASETVIRLAARVEGVAYVEPRSYRLKGLAEPVRAVGVVSESRIPRGFQRRLRRAGSRLAIDRRLALVGVAAIAVAIAGVSLSGVLGGRAPAGPSPAPSASPDPLAGVELPVVAFVDPSSGAVIDSVAVPNPIDISVFADGKFWILGENPWAVYGIDPATHEIVKTVTVPIQKPGFGTVVDGTIWLADHGEPRVVGIDEATGVVRRELRVSDEPGRIISVAVGDGSLWVARHEDGEVLRLDPETGVVQATIPIPLADIVAYGEDALWVTGGGDISRIEPATNRVTFTETLSAGNFISSIAFGAGFAWMADEVTDTVFRVDRTGQHVSYLTGSGARPVAFGDGKAWVANQDGGTISGIDPVTGAITNYKLGPNVLSIAAGDGQLMVAVAPSIAQVVDEALADLPGTSLSIAVPGQPLFNPDPPVNSSMLYRQVAYATCAPLFNYPDAPAPEGFELRPEVAEAMPDVSADGLTYTIRVRDGFAFSPPSSEPLTAETYRYTIERALSPKLGARSRGMDFLGDIVGARAFREGTADAVEGLRAEGNTLTITLERPSGSLAGRLALPYFCPVPRGTPPVLDGLDPVPPLPAAGPYYLALHIGGELGILRRNPNYHGDRPSAYDAILLRTGLDPGAAIPQVTDGTADATVATPSEPRLSVTSEVASEWGPGSAAAGRGDQRWFGAPRFGTAVVAMNPRSPLFQEATVRQAVTLAIDRAALAAAYNYVPWAANLPPSVLGSPPPDSTVPGPDPEAAASLMGGRRGRAVIAVFRDRDTTDFGNTLQANLAGIGIDVEVRQVDDPYAAAAEPGTDIDLFNGFPGTDFPDPGDLLASMRDEVPWLPDDVLAELDRIDALNGDARAAAAAALADRLSNELFLAIPVGYPVYPMYIGEKVGCAFVQPAIGAVDLGALCPK